MTDTTTRQIVFTEIPASNPARACTFYETLLQGPLTRDDNGPHPVWMFPHAPNDHAAGHVCAGQPATGGSGMIAHFAVIDDLADAMKRVQQGGGEVMSPVVDIPAGSFFYARDSEGNSLGIFKYRD